MARHRTAAAIRPLVEINLTPIMDLSFLLLITFIITYPLLEQGIPLKLPKGATANLQDENVLAISLDAGGQLFVGHEAVTLDVLDARLKAAGGAEKQPAVLVRADEALAYGRVVEILKHVYAAKLTRLALVTQPEK